MKSNWLFQNLKDTFIGTSEFIIGFILGTILDVMFFKLYKKIDPEEKNNKILFTMIIIQLFILIFLISLTIKYVKIEDNMGNFFLRLGIITSQLFLLEFSLERLADYIYDREKNESKLKSSLVNMPIIGSLFGF